MAIRVAAQRISVATSYGTNAPNGALFTADPGATGTASTELAASGTPAYARKAWNWGAATDNGTTATITGSATFDVYSGVTVAFIGACGSLTRGGADVRDTVDSVDQAFASQGTYAVTASYAQT